MNLREFFNYRTQCLSCGHNLSSFFQTNKKQRHRIEEGRFVAIFQMKGIKKHQKSYRVGYSIGMEDNSLRIEFYDQDDVTYYNAVPLWLINRFKKFHQNVGDHRVNKHCPVCKQYYYESETLRFDFTNGKIEDFKISDEWVRFMHPISDIHKVYSIQNFYDCNRTWITTYKSDVVGEGHTPVSVPLIAISSIPELKKKIDNIMPFA